MSYCRWSSDDFQCDIYCYEGYGGYVIHVATHRHVFAGPLPPPAETPEEWVERHLKVMSMLEDATKEPIGLQHDGNAFHYETPAEAADALMRLRGSGYNVPQGAIDALLFEALENETEV